MKDLAKLIGLQLLLLYRRHSHASARRFRSGIETTIAFERARAQRLVEHTELELRRAEIAIVAHRADRRLTDTATETR